MKIWVTKYALTEGIRETEAETFKNFPNMVKDVDRPTCYLHGEGREWHRTRDSAVKRAEQMRLAKIASVRKQLAQLESLKFDE